MSGITVDGVLDDWPEELPRYRIEQTYFSNPPENEVDFDAHFRVTYQPGSRMLFVAVEVEDESHQVEAEGRDWWNDDSCVLYFDRTHSPLGSGPVAFAIAGTRREFSGQAGIPWDPAVSEASWEEAVGAVVRAGTRTTYEWSVDAGTPLVAGKTLGMDLVLIDLDEGEADADGSYSCWGEGLFKNRVAGRCGAVLLVDSDDPLGVLQGEVRWRNLSELPLPNCVRVTSIADEAELARHVARRGGRYQLELPAGRYRMQPAERMVDAPEQWLRIADETEVAVSVEAGAEVQAPPLTLSLAPAPDLLEEIGVLLDYTEESAASVDRFVSAWMKHYEIPGSLSGSGLRRKTSLPKELRRRECPNG